MTSPTSLPTSPRDLTQPPPPGKSPTSCTFYKQNDPLFARIRQVIKHMYNVFGAHNLGIFLSEPKVKNDPLADSPIPAKQLLSQIKQHGLIANFNGLKEETSKLQTQLITAYQERLDLAHKKSILENDPVNQYPVRTMDKYAFSFESFKTILNELDKLKERKKQLISLKDQLLKGRGDEAIRYYEEKISKVATLISDPIQLEKEKRKYTKVLLLPTICEDLNKHYIAKLKSNNEQFPEFVNKWNKLETVQKQIDDNLQVIELLSNSAIPLLEHYLFRRDIRKSDQEQNLKESRYKTLAPKLEADTKNCENIAKSDTYPPLFPRYILPSQASGYLVSNISTHFSGLIPSTLEILEIQKKLKAETDILQALHKYPQYLEFVAINNALARMDAVISINTAQQGTEWVLVNALIANFWLDESKYRLFLEKIVGEIGQFKIKADTYYEHPEAYDLIEDIWTLWDEMRTYRYNCNEKTVSDFRDRFLKFWQSRFQKIERDSTALTLGITGVKEKLNSGLTALQIEYKRHFLTYEGLKSANGEEQMQSGKFATETRARANMGSMHTLMGSAPAPTAEKFKKMDQEYQKIKETQLKDKSS